MTSVRAKLILASLALVVGSMAAADAYLTSTLATQMTDVIRSGLLARASLVGRDAAAFRVAVADPVDRAAWDGLADAMGASAGARVTLLRPDGLVLGDSEVALPDLARGDSRSLRPEVEAALASGQGTAERHDAALRDSTLYAAVVFRRDGGVAGVARVAQPLTAVDHARAEARQLIWGGAVLALVMALLLSSLVARQLTASVRSLADAARRMTEGDLTVRVHLASNDALVDLGGALDRLAAGLAATLGQLRAERDLQRRILEAMQEGVVVVDKEGHIVLVNSALRSMLLIGAESVGKLLIETVRHAELDDLLEDARGASGAAPTEIEVPGLKPRRLLVHASPLSGDDERVLLVFVDVTELRRLESLRREFVANASHELRTPIAAVRSATETLHSGALDDPGAAVRFLDIIERNAQRLQSLVEDMLDLSKLESNEFRLKRERVELGSVVPIVVALFRERAEKKGVKLTSELPRTSLAVEGDPRGLEHVLSNLVDNAVKYCPPGSTIIVRAAQEGERVRMVVSDTGPGIPAEHLPRLFERFYRVDAGRSRELGGTGLGLSIVKHMAEAMRGAVSVESAVGKGSTFTVSLGAAKT